MKENKEDDNMIKTMDFSEISSRLVIKNIPESLSDNKLIEILKKNFEGHIKNDILICKLVKKYSMKKRNKICYITVDNLETRNKVYEFFSSFELVDPRGFKQKLTINDAIYQFRQKGIDDPLNNTIDSCEHFLKFKEYFSKEKIVEFKYEENNFCDHLFDGVDLNNSLNENKSKKINNINPSKMIIIKKEINNNHSDKINENEEINIDNNEIHENNNNRSRYTNNKIRNHNNSYYEKGKNKDNYYNSNNYYNDYNYDSYKNKKDYYNDYKNNYEGYNNYDNNYYGKSYNKKNGYRNKGYK